MSYEKMMKWNKNNRKGTKPPVIMHADSGFWPSASFSKKWVAYAEKLEAAGKPYLSIEEYYKTVNRL